MWLIFWFIVVFVVGIFFGYKYRDTVAKELAVLSIAESLKTIASPPADAAKAPLADTPAAPAGGDKPTTST